MEVKSSDKEWRRISSSTPPKSPLTPKPSASDENDQFYQQLGNSKLQSPKKPLTKNYMSPTISAASKSKVIASRKNILGERNEASQPDFSNTYVEKSQSPNLQSPKKPLTKNYISPTISISASSKPKAIASTKNILGERNEASGPNFSNTHVEKSHIAIDNASDSLSQALPKTPPSFQSHDVDEPLSDDLSSRPKAIASRKNILSERNEASKPDFSNTYVEKSHIAIDNFSDSLSQALPKTPPSFQSHDVDEALSDDLSSRPKAIASRKNILSERNEASEPDFSNTHVEKSHIAIDNASDSLSQALPKTPPSFQSHDVDEALSHDLSSRPYDPETNYLSPRPQFLRYKPNRRQELFLGLENGVELRISTSGSFDSQKATDEEVGAVKSPGSLASPHLDGSLQQEDEEVELCDEETEASDEETEGGDEGSDEEEYEEVEEEKGGKLIGGLKILLLLLAIVLFSSYMSPINHQTHFEGVEDAYCSIQNSTIEAALLKKLETGGNLWDQKAERRTGFMEVIKGPIEMEAEEVNVQGEETQIDEDIEDEAKVEGENLGDVELADEMREVVGPQAEEIEEEKEGGIDELDEVVVVPQLEDIEEISGDIVENSELQGVRPSVSDDFDQQNLVSDVSNTFEEGEVAAEQIDGIIEKKIEGAEQFSTNMAAEPVKPETMDNDDTSFDEVSDLKAEGNWREELINFMISKTFYTAAIGVSVFSVIVAFLVSVFRFKRRNTTKKDSRVIASPSAKPLVIKQKKFNGNNSVFPSRGDDSIEHVYSSFRRMSLSSKHATGAASGEYFHSQAPTVELLSELVVGEVSSSLRSCDMKNKMTEGEESNYSGSSKKLGSKAQSVSIQAQPTESEFSSMDSHSYRSFGTPQKVMKKKEGGKDGEITTPLRRSSRLRNRTVTSP